MLLIVISLITACSGSDDTPDTQEDEKTILQFYNASSNSPSISLRDIDKQGLGHAGYGDATQIVNLVSGEHELQLFRTELDGSEVVVEDITVQLANNKKTLLVLTGDIDSASVHEYEFEFKELNQHFRLFATSNVSNEASFDLYMAEEGVDFVNANFMGTVDFGALEELNYWAGDEDSSDFDIGSFILFMTEPGSQQVLFESSEINLRSATEYIVSIRESNGIIDNQLNLDIISNSTSVGKYSHVNSPAQYRVYNSLDGQNEMEISFMGDSSGNVSNEFTLLANSISEFTEIEFGDYRISALSKQNPELKFNSRLVTLNKGVSKAIVIYQDEDNALTTLEFIEDGVAQAFTKQLNVVNLQNTLQNISLYFVKSNETIDSAKYKITSLEFGKARELSVPSDFYELIAIHTDDNGSKTLLDRTPLLGINEDKLYIVTIESDLDAPSGYKLTLL
ncbi:DUF4397 domain-containing protein [Paraglaciecola aquimarina]|uniref:DUF4397 domain-containing protein n=1 Tax=Paraglaciecola algarum TaxID=3050085 RepID=A0ABS9DBZ3_9ALTE|nr:DUF4397 domain-containing protein [Paraglaciecola sp. G1-23]